MIEAVFENQELKHKVFQEIEDIVEPNAILGSNTSTMPITGLATEGEAPGRLHRHPLLSPVDKMPLGGDHQGREDSDEALARCSTTPWRSARPIVVNDSRGFFTSRVIGTFINEAPGDASARASSLRRSSMPAARLATWLRRVALR